MDSHDLEATERAALSIGDRQAAAKARATREEIDRGREAAYHALADQLGMSKPCTSVSLLYREWFD